MRGAGPWRAALDRYTPRVLTILGASGLRRTYGTRDVFADVSLSLAEGERVGFVGRNGAGKSTLALSHFLHSVRNRRNFTLYCLF